MDISDLKSILEINIKNIKDITLQKQLIDLFAQIKELEDLLSQCQDDLKLKDSIIQEIDNLKPNIKDKLIESHFKSVHNVKRFIVEIKSGAGGADAEDWTQILLNMYLKFFKKNKYKVEIMDLSKTNNGIRQCILEVKGKMLDLVGEVGIHRLVRISPFKSNKTRQTSFASFYMYPYITSSDTIDIKEKDLRIETYKSSGAGGQHVNTTDSAVRITHIPTGFVSQSQGERSQHQNKSTALSMLHSKILDYHNKKIHDSKNIYEKSSISWGNQCRSYVFHPYQIVKDTRTQSETRNIQRVLDGGIDIFFDSFMEFSIKTPLGL